MNSDPRFVITSKQVIFIIVSTTVATGLLSLPRMVAERAGSDGWISTILGAPLPIISLLLINRLARKFPDNDFNQLNRQLMGRYLSWIPLIIITVYIVFLNSAIVRLFVEITSIYLLSQTPLWAILLIVMASVFYIARYGIRVVGRVSELLFYLLFVIPLLALPTLSLFEMTNFLPIGGSGVKAILSSSIDTIFAFEGIEIMLIMFFMVQKREELARAGFIATALSLVTFIWWVVFCLGVFGPYAIRELVFPVFSLLKCKEVFFFERLEFAFFLVWAGFGCRPTISWVSAGGYLLVRSLGLDLQKHYKPAVGLLCLIIFGLALMPADINQLFQFRTYVSYSVFITAIGLPLLYNLLDFFRRII